MTTLAAIIKDLQQVPPENLEKAHQAVQALKTAPTTNKDLADWTLQFAGMLSGWTAEEWADFEDELQRTRADLFNRPVPEL